MRSVLLRLGHWARLIATSQSLRSLRVLRTTLRCTCSAVTVSLGLPLCHQPLVLLVLPCITRRKVELLTMTMLHPSKASRSRPTPRLPSKLRSRMPLQAITLAVTTKPPPLTLALLPYFHVRTIFKIASSASTSRTHPGTDLEHESCITRIISKSVAAMHFPAIRRPSYSGIPHHNDMSIACGVLHSFLSLTGPFPFLLGPLIPICWLRIVRHGVLHMPMHVSFRQLAYASSRAILGVSTNIWSSQ